MRRILFLAAIGALAVGFPSPMASSSKKTEKDSDEAQRAYAAYVNAWKRKDIPALEKMISDDYMAVNFHGEVSNKENELATAKADAEWTSMIVDEIHTRIFGNTAVTSGFVSAQGKRTDGEVFNAKVRFLGVLVKRGTAWQLVATQSTSFKPVATH